MIDSIENFTQFVCMALALIIGIEVYIYYAIYKDKELKEEYNHTDSFIEIIHPTFTKNKTQVFLKNEFSLFSNDDDYIVICPENTLETKVFSIKNNKIYELKTTNCIGFYYKGK